jgi:hypothetical protein
MAFTPRQLEAMAHRWLKRELACDASLDWIAHLKRPATPDHIWKWCHRSDWMIWALHNAMVKTRPGLIRAFTSDAAENLLIQIGIKRNNPTKRVQMLWEGIDAARAYSTALLSNHWGVVDDLRASMRRVQERLQFNHDPMICCGFGGVYGGVFDRAVIRTMTCYASDGAWYIALVGMNPMDQFQDEQWAIARKWQADRLRHYLPRWPGSPGGA